MNDFRISLYLMRNKRILKAQKLKLFNLGKIFIIKKQLINMLSIQIHYLNWRKWENLLTDVNDSKKKNSINYLMRLS